MSNTYGTRSRYAAFTRIAFTFIRVLFIVLFSCCVVIGRDTSVSLLVSFIRGDEMCLECLEKKTKKFVVPLSFSLSFLDSARV